VVLAPPNREPGAETGRRHTGEQAERRRPPGHAQDVPGHRQHDPAHLAPVAARLIAHLADLPGQYRAGHLDCLSDRVTRPHLLQPVAPLFHVPVRAARHIRPGRQVHPARMSGRPHEQCIGAPVQLSSSKIGGPARCRICEAATAPDRPAPASGLAARARGRARAAAVVVSAAHQIGNYGTRLHDPDVEIKVEIVS
jgi:hypothetical protein